MQKPCAWVFFIPTARTPSRAIVLDHGGCACLHSGPPSTWLGFREPGRTWSAHGTCGWAWLDVVRGHIWGIVGSQVVETGAPMKNRLGL